MIKAKSIITLVALAAVLVLAILFTISREEPVVSTEKPPRIQRTKSVRHPLPQHAASADNAAKQDSMTDNRDSEKPAATQPAPAMPPAAAKYLTTIESAWDDLRNGNETQRKQALATLREMFEDQGLDKEAAVTAIVEFLKSGRDEETGEPFTVDVGGILATASTLRVLLMDQLGTLSQETKSQAALNMAREVLARKRSADEWAVSLRNVAWIDPDSRGFLQGKSSEMLNHQPWVEQPSSGMMEAFDVIVHVNATDLIPKLEAISGDPESPLGRASAVALDRLAERNPAATAAYLLEHPEAMGGTPLVRADLFAKVDLNESAQRQQLESYLSRKDIDLAEKTQCLETLATPGSFLSNNLLTPPPPPVTAESEEARLALLRGTLVEWSAANKFPDLLQPITEIAARLVPEPE